MDPRSLGVADRARSSLNVRRLRAGEARDDRSLDLPRDRLDRLEVAGRGDREARLDDVDAKARELVGDLELLGGVQRDAGRLLAVAQGRVEDADVVGVVLVAAHDGCLLLAEGSWCAASQSVCGSAAATQIASPYRGSRRSSDSASACVMHRAV